MSGLYYCDGDYDEITAGDCVEIGVDGAVMGLSEDLAAIHLYFDNAATPLDDHVEFDFDVPTAVELSSFSATSQSRSADEPGLTSAWPVALVSGVRAVSAGGLVLWRRKGLAR